MGAQGEPGGVLIIHETPFAGDGTAGVLFSSKMGKWIREEVAKRWDGPVAFDAALRCDSAVSLLTPTHNKQQKKKQKDQTEKSVKACAGYIHAQIARMKPTRIICLGPVATEIVLGRSLDYYSVRGGVSWYDARIPVFVFPRLSDLGNARIRAWFLTDLTRALQTPVDQLWAPPLQGVVRLVETAEQAVQAADELMQTGHVYVDTETCGVLFSNFFRVLCVAVAPANADYAYVWTRTAMDDPAAVAQLRRVLEAPTPLKSGQNFKYDRKSLRSIGIGVRSVEHDIRLERKMLYADADAYLETMGELVGMGGHKEEADKYVTKGARKITDTRKKVAEGKIRLEDIGDEIMVAACRNTEVASKTYAFAYIPDDILHRYCAMDAIATARIDEFLQAQFEADDTFFLREHYERLVRPASDAIGQIEEWGVLVSQEGLQQARLYCETRLAQLNAVIEANAPGINLNSVPQLRELLYKKLKLPVRKFTDEGEPSTDSEALDAIKDLHPLVATIQEYRDISKIYGTYVIGLTQRVGRDGRIHPTFLIDGARSGRMSCTEPNLQNIPRKDTPEGKMVKDLFIAPPGYVLVQFDYSQLELRVAALMSADPLMAEIYTSTDPKTGKALDYHKRTAELISVVAWGIPPDKILDEHRSKAKTVNFGLLYGMTDSGLAERLKCTKDEAAKIRKAIFGRFAKLAKWIDSMVDIAKQNGYCYTMWKGQPARRRPLVHLADPLQSDGRPTYEYITAKNSSFNTPVQGTASDFMLASIVEIVAWILTNDIPAKLVLTVHDSVILEVRADVLDLVIKTVKAIMESQGWGNIPIKVDVEVGTMWGSLKKA